MVRASLNRLTVLLLVLLASALPACKRDGVSDVGGALRFEPTTLEFEPGIADSLSRELEVQLINEGRATAELEWSALPLPFSAELPTSAPSGSSTFIIRFTPTIPGVFSSVLEVKRSGTSDKPARLSLGATAHEIPTCQTDDPCQVAEFDRSLGACRSHVVEDGTSCGANSNSKCLINARCEAGRCVGEAKSCNDDNKCTIDVCYPLTGCEFLPAPPCPGDGACMEGVCDPATGCGLTPRADGSSCGGLSTSCTTANVCIDGVCEVRDPPDGFICREASPCNDEGRCLGDVCVTNALPTTLHPSWSLDTATLTNDGGNPAPRLHDFVLEPQGQLSLSGFFDVPAVLRANTVNAVAAPLGPSRRCILWGTRYVCADYPSTPNGKVTALDLDTGQAVWTFDIRAARPEYLDIVSTIFLARLVVQDSDRLAAIFEAYPKNVTGDSTTQCRRYFLAVIDASGHLVQAQQVVDPLFDTCNHPHPYGVAADALGNLFIAYSPTVSNSAPLVPADTTLLISFSRDGVFRWKRLNTGMRGGELAVARGLLYAEYTNLVLDATSGQVHQTLPGLLGRAVVSSTRLIPAPTENQSTLAGYEAGLSALRWTASTPSGWSFWSDQIRLAKWQTSRGERVVALTWVQDTSAGTPTHALQAFDVQDGVSAFTCVVDLEGRTPPQLFEVANGSVAMMNGALDSAGNPGCSKCDPPLAGSAGAFFSIPTPTLSQASEPWVGTFGGAGHDHHEN